jgi:hypothetical protein
MSKNKEDFIEIFLVPGFLGFKFLGDLDYFLDVEQVLKRRLAEEKITARIHKLGTKVPAGSVRLRAAYVAKEAAQMHSKKAKSVHFVGHSTGGLDIRMLLSPGGAIDTGRDFTNDPKSDERVYLTPAEEQNLPDLIDKTRSATSVATPHRGTPIANFAMRFAADRLLRGIHHVSERPLPEFVLKESLAFTSCVTKPIKPFLCETSFLNWIVGTVLSADPDKVVEYVQQAGADVGALRNLTQEGMNMGDALLLNREDVRYGSIITGTNEPTCMITTGDFLMWWTTAFFRVARFLVSRKNEDYAYITEDLEKEMRKFYCQDRIDNPEVGELEINDETSDGIVPTLSQPYGEILGVFASDHLDCVGHFPHYRENGDAVSGWVRSGAGFNEERHELLWTRVADFIAR